MDDTRSRKVYRACPDPCSAIAVAVTLRNLTAPTDNERERRSEHMRTGLRRSTPPVRGPILFRKREVPPPRPEGRGILGEIK
ncbi:hypothetical protein GCM10017750_21050 [Streptomyces racemochromogenes]